jgi:hypothetical protein
MSVDLSVISIDQTSSISTFTQVPIEEIYRFLRSCKANLPASTREAYEIAWELINNTPEVKILSGPLEDFIIAYNHQEEIKENYSISFILRSPVTQLVPIAQSLGISENKERLIRILGYLGLLICDMSLFDVLPRETMKIIISYLDHQALSFLGEISRAFHQLYQEEILDFRWRETLYLRNSLDFDHYTRGQLQCLSSSLTYRDRLAYYDHNILMVTSQGMVMNYRILEPTHLGGSSATSFLLDLPYRIQAISSGGGHVLLLTEDGRVLSYGRNTCGQLGLGDYQDRQEPVLIPGLHGIVAVSAGMGHSLVLNRKGEVFGFGSNTCGQLHLVDTLNHLPLKIERLEDIISITSGHFHSLALDKNGSVYAFGSNRNGQLGVAMDMTEFVSHSMRDIIFIAAGGNTSGFLDNKGKVCLCGIIRTNSLRCPHEINILSNIISASVQGYRSLFLSNEGKIFGFVDAGMNQISIAELVSSGALATLVTPDGRWVLTNQGELREIRSQRIIKVIL